MTDRIHSITIVLDKDLREDDCDALMTACRAFRGVCSVTANVADFASHMAEQRAKAEIGRRLVAVLYPEKAGEE